MMPHHPGIRFRIQIKIMMSPQVPASTASKNMTVAQCITGHVTGVNDTSPESMTCHPESTGNSS